jgi:hypothetical protein
VRYGATIDEKEDLPTTWTSQMRSFSVTVQTEVASPQAEALNYIVPIDLTSIFQGHGLLPVVKGTQNQTGAWDAVGQTRTVILSDGSSAQERLTGYEQPHYFSYTVSEFSGVSKRRRAKKRKLAPESVAIPRLTEAEV